jgi:hypothetical protein
LPKNWNNPFLTISPVFNPLGLNYIDYGLGGRLSEPAQNGKFKVPTLRNITRTAPYGHNGYFQTLTQIINFYNTRDVSPSWPDPEVPQNVNMEIGDLGLMPCQINKIVAFLNTLTDGYDPALDQAVDEPALETALPVELSMVSAYPNPFNPSTTIRYQLSGRSQVSLRVYDTTGRVAAVLVDGWREAGAHEVTFDGSNLPSGVYVFRLSAGSWSESGKLALVK